MRGLQDSRETLLYISRDATDRVRHAWEGFVDFAMRENVLEVAIGLMIGNAFTKVVTSFVSDVILPIISLLPFLHRNLDEKFSVLKSGPNYDLKNGYNTLAQARDDGALVMAYGAFLNHVISFLGVGMVLYGLAHFYVLISHDGSMMKRVVKCRYCMKWINHKVSGAVYELLELAGRKRGYPFIAFTTTLVERRIRLSYSRLPGGLFGFY